MNFELFEKFLNDKKTHVTRIIIEGSNGERFIIMRDDLLKYNDLLKKLSE